MDAKRLRKSPDMPQFRIRFKYLNRFLFIFIFCLNISTTLIFLNLDLFHLQDLIDLEPNEYSLLKMRPLEAKRFEGAMIAVEEEFNP